LTANIKECGQQSGDKSIKFKGFAKIYQEVIKRLVLDCFLK